MHFISYYVLSDEIHDFLAQMPENVSSSLMGGGHHFLNHLKKQNTFI